MTCWNIYNEYMDETIIGKNAVNLQFGFSLLRDLWIKFLNFVLWQQTYVDYISNYETKLYGRNTVFDKRLKNECL